MWCNNRTLAITLSILLLTTSGGAANVFSSKGRGTRGPAVLSMDPGARTAGTAGAFAVALDDGEALTTNPAGLHHLSASELRFSGGEGFSEQKQMFLGYSRPVWRRGERETWGGYVHRLAMDSFDVFEAGETIGTVEPQDWVAGLAYARPAPFGHWGMALKGVATETFETSGQTVALDFGVQGGGTRWAWGAALTNLGPSYTFGSETVGLPTRLRAGVNRSWNGVKGSVRAALLGDLPSDDDPGAAMGVEVERRWGNGWSAALRGGIRSAENNPLAFGAGVGRHNLSIQYALTPLDEDGSLGQLDVVYRFGGELTQETRRRALMEEARAALAQDDFGKAQSALDEVFALSPRYGRGRALERELRLRVSETLDPVALMDLGRRAAAAGEDEKAADAFRKLLIVNPDDAAAKKELAAAEKRIQDQRTARLREEVEQARAVDRARWAREAQSAEWRGDWPAALGLWVKVGKAGGDASAGLERARAALYQEAEAAASAGNLEKAHTLFKQIDSGGPYQDVPARIRANEKVLAERRAALALEKYRLGQKEYLSGNVAEAEKLFEESLGLNPDSRVVRQALDHLREERRLRGQ